MLIQILERPHGQSVGHENRPDSSSIIIIRRRSLFNPNTVDGNDADAVEDIPDGESVWEHDSASPPKSLFVIPNTPRLMGGVHSH